MRNPEGWWRIGDTELFSSYIYGQTVRPSPLVTGFCNNYLAELPPADIHSFYKSEPIFPL